MLENVLSRLILSHASNYINNLNVDNLSLWSGDVILQKLDLNLEEVAAALHIDEDFELTSGFISNLHLRIPWNALRSSPVNVLLDRIEIVITRRSYSDIMRATVEHRKNNKSESARKDQNQQSAKSVSNDPLNDFQNNLSNVQSNSSKQHPEQIQNQQIQQQPGFLSGFINTILMNVRLVINNLVVKYVHDAHMTASLLIGEIKFEPCKPRPFCSPEFCFPHGPHGIVHRLSSITDVTVLIDSSIKNKHGGKNVDSTHTMDKTLNLNSSAPSLGPSLSLLHLRTQSKSKSSQTLTLPVSPTFSITTPRVPVVSRWSVIVFTSLPTQTPPAVKLASEKESSQESNAVTTGEPIRVDVRADPLFVRMSREQLKVLGCMLKQIAVDKKAREDRVKKLHANNNQILNSSSQSVVAIISENGDIDCSQTENPGMANKGDINMMNSNDGNNSNITMNFNNNNDSLQNSTQNERRGWFSNWFSAPQNTTNGNEKNNKQLEAQAITSETKKNSLLSPPRLPPHSTVSATSSMGVASPSRSTSKAPHAAIVDNIDGNEELMLHIMPDRKRTPLVASVSLPVISISFVKPQALKSMSNHNDSVFSSTNISSSQFENDNKVDSHSTTITVTTETQSQSLPPSTPSNTTLHSETTTAQPFMSADSQQAAIVQMHLEKIRLENEANTAPSFFSRLMGSKPRHVPTAAHPTPFSTHFNPGPLQQQNRPSSSMSVLANNSNTIGGGVVLATQTWKEKTIRDSEMRRDTCSMPHFADYPVEQSIDFEGIFVLASMPPQGSGVGEISVLVELIRSLTDAPSSANLHASISASAPSSPNGQGDANSAAARVVMAMGVIPLDRGPFAVDAPPLCPPDVRTAPAEAAIRISCLQIAAEELLVIEKRILGGSYDMRDGNHAMGGTSKGRRGSIASMHHATSRRDVTRISAHFAMFSLTIHSDTIQRVHSFGGAWKAGNSMGCSRNDIEKNFIDHLHGYEKPIEERNMLQDGSSVINTSVSIAPRYSNTNSKTHVNSIGKIQVNCNNINDNNPLNQSSTTHEKDGKQQVRDEDQFATIAAAEDDTIKASKIDSTLDITLYSAGIDIHIQLHSPASDTTDVQKENNVFKVSHAAMEAREYILTNLKQNWLSFHLSPLNLSLQNLPDPIEHAIMHLVEASKHPYLYQNHSLPQYTMISPPSPASPLRSPTPTNSFVASNMSASTVNVPPSYSNFVSSHNVISGSEAFSGLFDGIVKQLKYVIIFIPSSASHAHAISEWRHDVLRLPPIISTKPIDPSLCLLPRTGISLHVPLIALHAHKTTPPPLYPHSPPAPAKPPSLMRGLVIKSIKLKTSISSWPSNAPPPLQCMPYPVPNHPYAATCAAVSIKSLDISVSPSLLAAITSAVYAATNSTQSFLAFHPHPSKHLSRIHQNIVSSTWQSEINLHVAEVLLSASNSKFALPTPTIPSEVRNINDTAQMEKWLSSVFDLKALPIFAEQQKQSHDAGALSSFTSGAHLWPEDAPVPLSSDLLTLLRTVFPRSANTHISSPSLPHTHRSGDASQTSSHTFNDEPNSPGRNPHYASSGDDVLTSMSASEALALLPHHSKASLMQGLLSISAMSLLRAHASVSKIAVYHNKCLPPMQQHVAPFASPTQFAMSRILQCPDGPSSPMAFTMDLSLATPLSIVSDPTSEFLMRANSRQVRNFLTNMCLPHISPSTALMWRCHPPLTPNSILCLPWCELANSISFKDIEEPRIEIQLGVVNLNMHLNDLTAFSSILAASSHVKEYSDKCGVGGNFEKDVKDLEQEQEQEEENQQVDCHTKKVDYLSPSNLIRIWQPIRFICPGITIEIQSASTAKIQLKIPYLSINNHIASIPDFSISILPSNHQTPLSILSISCTTLVRNNLNTGLHRNDIIKLFDVSGALISVSVSSINIALTKEVTAALALTLSSIQETQNTCQEIIDNVGYLMAAPTTDVESNCRLYPVISEPSKRKAEFALSDTQNEALKKDELNISNLVSMLRLQLKSITLTLDESSLAISLPLIALETRQVTPLLNSPSVCIKNTMIRLAIPSLAVHDNPSCIQTMAISDDSPSNGGGESSPIFSGSKILSPVWLRIMHREVANSLQSTSISTDIDARTEIRIFLPIHAILSSVTSLAGGWFNSLKTPQPADSLRAQFDSDDQVDDQTEIEPNTSSECEQSEHSNTTESPSKSVETRLSVYFPGISVCIGLSLNPSCPVPVSSISAAEAGIMKLRISQSTLTSPLRTTSCMQMSLVSHVVYHINPVVMQCDAVYLLAPVSVSLSHTQTTSKPGQALDVLSKNQLVTAIDIGNIAINLQDPIYNFALLPTTLTVLLNLKKFAIQPLLQAVSSTPAAANSSKKVVYEDSRNHSSLAAVLHETLLTTRLSALSLVGPSIYLPSCTAAKSVTSPPPVTPYLQLSYVSLNKNSTYISDPNLNSVSVSPLPSLVSETRLELGSLSISLSEALSLGFETASDASAGGKLRSVVDISVDELRNETTIILPCPLLINSSLRRLIHWQVSVQKLLDSCMIAVAQADQHEQNENQKHYEETKSPEFQQILSPFFHMALTLPAPPTPTRLSVIIASVAVSLSSQVSHAGLEVLVMNLMLTLSTTVTTAENDSSACFPLVRRQFAPILSFNQSHSAWVPTPPALIYLPCETDANSVDPSPAPVVWPIASLAPSSFTLSTIVVNIASVSARILAPSGFSWTLLSPVSADVVVRTSPPSATTLALPSAVSLLRMAVSDAVSSVSVSTGPLDINLHPKALAILLCVVSLGPSLSVSSKTATSTVVEDANVKKQTEIVRANHPVSHLAVFSIAPNFNTPSSYSNNHLNRTPSRVQMDNTSWNSQFNIHGVQSESNPPTVISLKNLNNNNLETTNESKANSSLRAPPIVVRSDSSYSQEKLSTFDEKHQFNLNRSNVHHKLSADERNTSLDSLFGLPNSSTDLRNQYLSQVKSSLINQQKQILEPTSDFNPSAAHLELPTRTFTSEEVHSLGFLPASPANNMTSSATHGSVMHDDMSVSEQITQESCMVSFVFKALSENAAGLDVEETEDEPIGLPHSYEKRMNERQVRAAIGLLASTLKRVTHAVLVTPATSLLNPNKEPSNRQHHKGLVKTSASNAANPSHLSESNSSMSVNNSSNNSTPFATLAFQFPFPVVVVGVIEQLPQHQYSSAPVNSKHSVSEHAAFTQAVHATNYLSSSSSHASASASRRMHCIDRILDSNVRRINNDLVRVYAFDETSKRLVIVPCGLPQPKVGGTFDRNTWSVAPVSNQFAVCVPRDQLLQKTGANIRVLVALPLSEGPSLPILPPAASKIAVRIPSIGVAVHSPTSLHVLSGHNHLTPALLHLSIGRTAVHLRTRTFADGSHTLTSVALEEVAADIADDRSFTLTRVMHSFPLSVRLLAAPSPMAGASGCIYPIDSIYLLQHDTSTNNVSDTNPVSAAVINLSTTSPPSANLFYSALRIPAILPSESAAAGPRTANLVSLPRPVKVTLDVPRVRALSSLSPHIMNYTDVLAHVTSPAVSTPNSHATLADILPPSLSNHAEPPLAIHNTLPVPLALRVQPLPPASVGDGAVSCTPHTHLPDVVIQPGETAQIIWSGISSQWCLHCGLGRLCMTGLQFALGLNLPLVDSLISASRKGGMSNQEHNGTIWSQYSQRICFASLYSNITSTSSVKIDNDKNKNKTDNDFYSASNSTVITRRPSALDISFLDFFFQIPFAQSDSDFQAKIGNKDKYFRSHLTIHGRTLWFLPSLLLSNFSTSHAAIKFSSYRQSSNAPSIFTCATTFAQPPPPGSSILPLSDASCRFLSRSKPLNAVEQVISVPPLSSIGIFCELDDTIYLSTTLSNETTPAADWGANVRLWSPSVQARTNKGSARLSAEEARSAFLDRIEDSGEYVTYIPTYIRQVNRNHAASAQRMNNAMGDLSQQSGVNDYTHAALLCVSRIYSDESCAPSPPTIAVDKSANTTKDCTDLLLVADPQFALPRVISLHPSLKFENATDVPIALSLSSTAPPNLPPSDAQHAAYLQACVSSIINHAVRSFAVHPSSLPSHVLFANPQSCTTSSTLIPASSGFIQVAADLTKNAFDSRIDAIAAPSPPANFKGDIYTWPRLAFPLPSSDALCLTNRADEGSSSNSVSSVELVAVTSSFPTAIPLYPSHLRTALASLPSLPIGSANDQSTTHETQHLLSRMRLVAHSTSSSSPAPQRPRLFSLLLSVTCQRLSSPASPHFITSVRTDPAFRIFNLTSMPIQLFSKVDSSRTFHFDPLLDPLQPALSAELAALFSPKTLASNGDHADGPITFQAHVRLPSFPNAPLLNNFEFSSSLPTLALIPTANSPASAPGGPISMPPPCAFFIFEVRPPTSTHWTIDIVMRPTVLAKMVLTCPDVDLAVLTLASRLQNDPRVTPHVLDIPSPHPLAPHLLMAETLCGVSVSANSSSAKQDDDSQEKKKDGKKEKMESPDTPIPILPFATCLLLARRLNLTKKFAGNLPSLPGYEEFAAAIYAEQLTDAPPSHLQTRPHLPLQHMHHPQLAAASNDLFLAVRLAQRANHADGNRPSIGPVSDDILLPVFPGGGLSIVGPPEHWLGGGAVRDIPVSLLETANSASHRPQVILVSLSYGLNLRTGTFHLTIVQSDSPPLCIKNSTPFIIGTTRPLAVSPASHVSIPPSAILHTSVLEPSIPLEPSLVHPSAVAHFPCAPLRTLQVFNAVSTIGDAPPSHSSNSNMHVHYPAPQGPSSSRANLLRTDDLLVGLRDGTDPSLSSFEVFTPPPLDKNRDFRSISENLDGQLVRSNLSIRIFAITNSSVAPAANMLANPASNSSSGGLLLFNNSRLAPGCRSSGVVSAVWTSPLYLRCMRDTETRSLIEWRDGDGKQLFGSLRVKVKFAASSCDLDVSLEPLPEALAILLSGIGGEMTNSGVISSEWNGVLDGVCRVSRLLSVHAPELYEPTLRQLSLEDVLSLPSSSSIKSNDEIQEEEAENNANLIPSPLLPMQHASISDLLKTLSPLPPPPAMDWELMPHLTQQITTLPTSSLLPSVKKTKKSNLSEFSAEECHALLLSRLATAMETVHSKILEVRKPALFAESFATVSTPSLIVLDVQVCSISIWISPSDTVSEQPSPLGSSLMSSRLFLGVDDLHATVRTIHRSPTAPKCTEKNTLPRQVIAVSVAAVQVRRVPPGLPLLASPTCPLPPPAVSFPALQVSCDIQPIPSCPPAISYIVLSAPFPEHAVHVHVSNDDLLTLSLFLHAFAPPHSSSAPQSPPPPSDLQLYMPESAFAAAVSTMKGYFRCSRLSIPSLRIRAWASLSSPIYLSLSDVSLELPSLALHDICTPPSVLSAELSAHVSAIILLRLPSLVSSLDFLGNPRKVLSHFNQAWASLKSNPLSLSNSFKAFKHVVSAPLVFISTMTETLSKNLPSLPNNQLEHLRLLHVNPDNNSQPQNSNNNNPNSNNNNNNNNPLLAALPNSWDLAEATTTSFSSTVPPTALMSQLNAQSPSGLLRWTVGLLATPAVALLKGVSFAAKSATSDLPDLDTFSVSAQAGDAVSNSSGDLAASNINMEGMQQHEYVSNDPLTSFSCLLSCFIDLPSPAYLSRLLSSPSTPPSLLLELLRQRGGQYLSLTPGSSPVAPCKLVQEMVATQLVKSMSSNGSSSKAAMSRMDKVRFPALAFTNYFHASASASQGHSTTVASNTVGVTVRTICEGLVRTLDSSSHALRIIPKPSSTSLSLHYVSGWASIMIADSNDIFRRQIIILTRDGSCVCLDASNVRARLISQVEANKNDLDLGGLNEVLSVVIEERGKSPQTISAFVVEVATQTKRVELQALLEAAAVHF